MLRLPVIASLVVVSLALVASPAFAVFSASVSVSPATDNNHRELRPVIKREGERISVRVPYQNDQRRYWLVVASRWLTSKEQNFRDVVLRGVGVRPDIVLTATLGPVSGSRDHDDIVLQLPREIAERAYIYHDYSGYVLDGGFYYTIDIPAYLLHTSK